VYVNIGSSHYSTSYCISGRVSLLVKILTLAFSNSSKNNVCFNSQFPHTTWPGRYKNVKPSWISCRRRWWRWWWWELEFYNMCEGVIKSSSPTCQYSDFFTGCCLSGHATNSFKALKARGTSGWCWPWYCGKTGYRFRLWSYGLMALYKSVYYYHPIFVTTWVSEWVSEWASE